MIDFFEQKLWEKNEGESKEDSKWASVVVEGVRIRHDAWKNRTQWLNQIKKYWENQESLSRPKTPYK